MVGFIGWFLLQSMPSLYRLNMQILIQFPDRETEGLALGKLIPRFSGKSWSSGEVMVPSAALAYLADEGISFTVIGPAPYERLTSIRDSGAVAV